MPTPLYTDNSILVIEDDRELRAVLVSHFEARGWTVHAAGEGEAGLELARLHRPDAVLCDLLLPGINGFQICQALRQRLGLDQTRIVAMSGRGYASNRRTVLDAGADDFIPKPICFVELDEAFARLMAGGPEVVVPLPAPVPEVKPVLIRFWGVRGSVPVPGPSTVEYGGNTSCIEVRADGELIVLDGGTGIRPLGQHLVEEFKDEPIEATILLSHTHWDHIQGLPFFAPSFQAKNRIQLLGYEGARAGLEQVFEQQMSNPFFPIAFKELPAEITVTQLKEMKFQVGAVRVEADFMNHPGICAGYRLETSGGTIAYLPDNEPFGMTEPTGDTQFSIRAQRQSYAQGEDKKMLEFIRGVDVLIMDAQYDAEEYKTHIGWGHGCLDQVVRLALRGGVKRLVLFHHDPNHDDEKVASMAEHARKMVLAAKSGLIVEAAREGAEIRLGVAAEPGEAGDFRLSAC